ncbi:ATP-binding cassette domain-containing protein, partial [Escherichia coli]
MLQISHLYADYGGKPALEDINLTLESGELLVVLGPSGCGKTTLLNLIAGFVPYQHGSIQLAGKGIQGPGAERGVVFQNEGLLPWRNVQDNVAFGLQLAGVEKMQRLEIAHQMLKKVGLEVNRPGFPGECFICELRLPDHRFRWKHNKLFLL